MTNVIMVSFYCYPSYKASYKRNLGYHVVNAIFVRNQLAKTVNESNFVIIGRHSHPLHASLA